MQGGMPRKHWESLRREVLHTYGHEHLLTLATLQDAGLTLGRKPYWPPMII